MSLFDDSARLRRVRQERWAESVARQQAMFDRSKGVAQDRLIEVVEEFEWLSPEQKALLLREAPSFYIAVAKLHEVYAVLQKTRSRP